MMPHGAQTTTEPIHRFGDLGIAVPDQDGEGRGSTLADSAIMRACAEYEEEWRGTPSLRPCYYWVY